VRKFVIEDTSHAEQLGEFGSLAEAVSELRRCAELAWDQPPNVAPCANWEACGRSYEIVEYEVSKQPWSELRRIAALEVSAKAAVWSATFERDIARPAE
jgi:hypothetical protein